MDEPPAQEEGAPPQRIREALTLTAWIWRLRFALSLCVAFCAFASLIVQVECLKSQLATQTALNATSPVCPFIERRYQEDPDTELALKTEVSFVAAKSQDEAAAQAILDQAGPEVGEDPTHDVPGPVEVVLIAGVTQNKPPASAPLVAKTADQKLSSGAEEEATEVEDDTVVEDAKEDVLDPVSDDKSFIREATTMLDSKENVPQDLKRVVDLVVDTVTPTDEKPGVSDGVLAFAVLCFLVVLVAGLVFCCCDDAVRCGRGGPDDQVG
jgi:hypothetical protein